MPRTTVAARIFFSRSSRLERVPGGAVAVSGRCDNESGAPRQRAPQGRPQRRLTRPLALVITSAPEPATTSIAARRSDHCPTIKQQCRGLHAATPRPNPRPLHRVGRRIEW